MRRLSPATSVRRKTMAVVLATAFVALLVNAVVLVVYEVSTYQAARVSEARAQAQILGRAAAPALAFNDRKEAEAAIATLRARPDLVAAALYGADGKVFAAYEAPEGALRGDEVRVRHDIVERGQRLGIAEVATRSGLYERILAYAGILVTVMAVALGAALLLSAWLQRVLTQPILEIDAAAREVVGRRDFRVRARRTTDDEIGRLADAFNRMLDEVEASQAELRAADRRKDEFLATLAHELRNPLAPIRNALYLLKTAPDAARAAGSRELIERQVNQMVRLIDDLIDVSRITTGKLPLRRERIDAVAVARSALEAAEPAATAREHRLRVSLPAGPLYVNADGTRLAQVFLNLLNNAVKFTDPGGEIGFELGLEHGMLVARVRDDGIGIAPHLLESIFEMFNQADRSLERTAGGLGVGLALTRRLVELHGGTVEARSEGPGRGAEFTVRIPAEGAATAVAGEAPASRAGGAKRILLVDDNRDFAQSLAAVLKRLGNEVRVEHDGEAGLAAAAGYRPDVAILDIGMPKLNGFDLAQRLRGAAATRSTILVAITGYSQPSDRARGREAGFDHYLIKPVEVDQLKEILGT